MVRKMWLAGAIALAAGLLAPASGRAAFTLTLSSGGTTQTFTGGATNISLSNVNFAGYTITTLNSLTNNPGTSQLGFLTVDALTVINNSATSPLVITASANDFTAPTGPVQQLASFSGRFATTATSGTIMETAAFDAGNRLNQTSGTVGPTPSMATFTPTSNLPQDVNSSVFSVNTRYSLTNQITISGLGVGVTNRLDAAGVSNSINSQGVPAVPAPATVIMLLAATPVLGLARRLRRGNAGAPLAV